MAQRDIGNLRTRLSWEDEGANKSLEGFKRDLRGLRSEMNLARSGGREYTNSLKGMREQSDILTRRFQTQQEQVKLLKDRYRELTVAGKEDTVQAKNLASQINNTTAEMNRTEAQLKRLNEEIRRMESPWTKLGTQLDATGEKMQKIGREMTEFGRSYSMRVTAPIVAGAGAVFKASMDYESAFAGVRKTVDATEEEFAQLSTGIREMTNVLPASATEIAAVGEAAGQLGIETENILGFTRTMIDLGEATNMTADTAATEFARFANIVGMSQKDFDRLGSVVVDLGNNLATTEAEIVSMAMRLAGAGAQIGLTEAEIMAFSGSLSSVGIAAEAGGSAFSKVMVEMQLAAELGGDDLKAFAKVAEMSADDFKKAFEQDAAGAIIKFIKGLSTAEDRGMSAIAVLDEMGITEVRMRDALLRAAGASDVFTDSIEMGSKAWDENIALTEEAEQRYGTTESQLKIMWNRVKDVAITLGDALVPAVMDAIDAATPLIGKIESGAQAFSEMDEEQQQTILKLIALTAAVGPASVVLGGLTTTVGGLTKGAGSLSTLLGKANGAGLVARIASLGPLGVGGLAVAGLAGIGVAVYNLTKDKSDLNEINWELVESLQAEVSETDELISSFEELENKNRLTKDEMIEYLDVLSELENTRSPEKIKELSDRQAELLEKSGFTNDEMETFIGLNDRIIEKSPEVVGAISEEGNAYADNLQALKDLNEEKRRELMMVAERELIKALENETQLLEDQRTLIEERNQAFTDYQNAHTEYVDNVSKINELQREQNGIYEELEEMQKNGLTHQDERMAKKVEELNQVSEELRKEREKEHSLESQVEKAEEFYQEKVNALEATEEELKKLDNLKWEYESIVLSHVNINAEKGKGLTAIDEELKKLKDQKKQMEENTAEGIKQTQEYRDQISEIDEQIGKLGTARDELEKMGVFSSDNKKDYEGVNAQLTFMEENFKYIQGEQDQSNKKIQAGIDYADDMNKKLEKGIDKDVIVDDLGRVDEINRELGRTINKTVRITTVSDTPSYAEGTSYHQGGPFMAGEEGFELGRLGARWEMLNFGFYDRPAGYQVFPHDESKRILRALNNMPAYASGARPSGEANRIVNDLNSQQKEQLPVANITINSRDDSESIARAVDRGYRRIAFKLG